MRRPLERDIQRACLQDLAARGLFARRQNAGVIPAGKGGFRRFVGMCGQSDIVEILGDGRFLVGEVKRPGCKLRPAQEEFLNRIAAKNGGACVVTSVEELERNFAEALGQTAAC
jgi:hypothetical protein